MYEKYANLDIVEIGSGCWLFVLKACFVGKHRPTTNKTTIVSPLFAWMIPREGVEVGVDGYVGGV